MSSMLWKEFTCFFFFYHKDFQKYKDMKLKYLNNNQPKIYILIIMIIIK